MSSLSFPMVGFWRRSSARSVAGAINSLLLATILSSSAATAEKIKAPTKLHSEPGVHLLRLGGDQVVARYSYGSLDRAARLQERLELSSRQFHKWTGLELTMNAYLLNRDEWEQSRYKTPYGLPVRVGSFGLAAPAFGDSGTVQLWTTVLDGMLPTVPGLPLRGTPQEAATLAVSDFLAQLQVSEIFVDAVEIGGDAYWVRSLITHVVAVAFSSRHEPDRIRELDSLYAHIAQRREPRAFAARDYNLDLSLQDWLWFQAHFHFGSKTILAKEGKGAVKKLRKLQQKHGGVLQGEELLRQYKALDEWFRASFAAVSMVK